MKFTEKIDLSNLQKIYDFYDFIPELNNKAPSKVRQQKNLFLKYVKNIDETGCYEVEYHNTSKHGGRLYSGQSLQCLPRAIRGTISQYNYYDVDIVNCHPVLIFYELCKRYNLETPTLHSYIHGRDEWLREMMNNGYTKNEAKTKVLECFFADTLNDDFFQFEELKLLHGEINKLKEVVVEDYPELYEERVKVCKKNGKTNYKGSTLSFVLQNIENEYLMKVIDTLRSKGIVQNDVVLCHDGFQISKEVNIDEVLQIVNDTTPDYLNWVVKPFDIINWDLVDLPSCTCKVKHRNITFLIEALEKKFKNETEISKRNLYSCLRNIFPTCIHEFVDKDITLNFDLDVEWLKSLYPKTSKKPDIQKVIGILNQIDTKHIEEDTQSVSSADFSEFTENEDVSFTPQMNTYSDDYLFNIIDFVRQHIFESKAEVFQFFRDKFTKVIYRMTNPAGWLVKSSPNKIEKMQKCPDMLIAYKDNGEVKYFTPTKALNPCSEFVIPQLYNLFTPITNIVFRPDGKLKAGDFNYFQGYVSSGCDTPVSSAELDKIEPLLSHMKVVWCNNDPVIYRYFLNYFAHIIQKPSVKTRVVPILYSKEQQIGKNILLDFFREFVIGLDYSIQRDAIADLTREKNGDLENRLFVVVNETSASKNKYHTDFDKLKDMITSDRIKIRHLYMNSYETDSFINFFFTSNNINSVKIEGKTDARYFPVQCNPCYRGNENYFRNLVNKCMNLDCGRIMYRYLYNFEITTDPRSFPNTPLRERIINVSLSPTELFLDEVLGLNDTELNENIDVLWMQELRHSLSKYFQEHPQSLELRITPADLWYVYTRWCEYSNEKRSQKKRFIEFVKSCLQTKTSNGKTWYKLPDNCNLTRTFQEIKHRVIENNKRKF